MGGLTRSKKQENRDYPVKSEFLKVVRPGGQVELYRDPIPAREIMRRFPRHCLTRPDFFDYPWIVVRPESVLVPGKVFFLVPNHTVDKVMKDKMQHFQHSLNQEQPSEPSPRGRGMAPAGQGRDRYLRRSNMDHDYHIHHRSNQHEDRYHKRQHTPYSHERLDQESDSGSLYKELFYESWEEMGRRLEQLHHESQKSALESGRPSRELEVVQRVKPCLRKAGSGREKLKLKVSFSSPIVIPGSHRGTPTHQGEDLDFKI